MGKTIYYWKGSAEMRQDLISALAGWGYDLYELRTLEEILDGLKREQPVMILVDGSVSDREASQRVVELSSTPQLYHLPVLLISRQASKRADTLQSHFKTVIPVDIPFSIDLVLLKVESAINPDSPARPEAQAADADLAPEASAEQQQERTETAVITAAEQQQERTETAVITADELEQGIRNRALRRIADNTPYVRARIAANPDPAKLTNTFGGEVFSLARQPEDFVDDKLLPRGKEASDVAMLLTTLASEDPWLATHGKRLAYVGAAISASCGYNEERDRNMRIAGLFLSWGCRDLPQEISRYDLLANPSKEMEQRLGQCFRASAAFVRDRVGSAGAARLIEAVASSILGEPAEADSHLRADAAALLCSELAARSCWGHGFWNPHGAYRAMRCFRDSPYIAHSSEVGPRIIRMLAEAVSTHVTVGNTFLSAIEDEFETGHSSQAEGARLSQEAVSAAMSRANELGSKTLQLPLSELAPGMLLLGPVLARDGRLVLQANVLLDEEIVHGLWQLAAVRALQAKVHVAVRSDGEASC